MESLCSCKSLHPNHKCANLSAIAIHTVGLDVWLAISGLGPDHPRFAALTINVDGWLYGQAASVATQHNWAGISNYYLWSCNATVRAEALNAVRAAGLRVVRVFLVSTIGGGAVAACADTPTPDVEPHSVGSYDDTILARLDQLMYEAAERGLKLTVALHDRWSLGCWRTDAYAQKYNLTRAPCGSEPGLNDPTAFYESSEALDDFNRRIHHILTYRSVRCVDSRIVD
eukprot:COSAG02_NODE_1580_length_11851_cov_35.748043_9_plen_228_part_00